jgi:hypothetical protein
MPHHVHGVLLRAMSGTELSRVQRTVYSGRGADIVMVQQRKLSPPMGESPIDRTVRTEGRV